MPAASTRALRPSSPSDRTEAGAEAAILARLWGTFAREPIPGVTRRHSRSGALHVQLADGSVLAGDAATAHPFAVADPGFAVTVLGESGPRAVTGPGELVRTIASVLGPHAGRLAAELDNSVANLALARAAQPAPDGGASMLDRAVTQPDPLVYIEQSVVDGHPLHPCARTRIGLSPDEVRAYAPEHRPTVMLRRVVVPTDRWHGEGSRPLLLMHPWQHDRILDEYPWLSEVDGEIPTRPLMSLRTLASATDRRHHVKTAVDIQMTSAVRTVSSESVHNGLQLSRLMQHVRRWTRWPGIDVLAELGGGAVIVDGEPDRRLAFVHRRMRTVAAGELALPLAALTAPSPATGAPLVADLVEIGYGGDALALVDALATTLLPPVFGLLGIGIALEAHGQNVLGVVRDARFIRLLYRDFGGVRVSPQRLRHNGIEPPPLLGDVLSDDPEVLRTKVLASAVSTVLGEVIAVLGRLGLDKQRAWHRVAEVARQLPAPDGLFADTLPVKAMTAMRLAQRPVDDLWCDLPNPMGGLG